MDRGSLWNKALSSIPRPGILFVYIVSVTLYLQSKLIFFILCLNLLFNEVFPLSGILFSAKVGRIAGLCSDGGRHLSSCFWNWDLTGLKCQVSFAYSKLKFLIHLAHLLCSHLYASSIPVSLPNLSPFSGLKNKGRGLKLFVVEEQPAV